MTERNSPHTYHLMNNCCENCASDMVSNGYPMCMNSSCECHQEEGKKKLHDHKGGKCLSGVCQSEKGECECDGSDLPCKCPNKSEGGNWRDKAVEDCIRVFGTKDFHGSYAAPREAFRKVLASVEERTRQALLKEIEDGMDAHETCINSECCAGRTWTLLSRLQGKDGK